MGYTLTLQDIHRLLKDLYLDTIIGANSVAALFSKAVCA